MLVSAKETNLIFAKTLDLNEKLEIFLCSHYNQADGYTRKYFSFIGRPINNSIFCKKQIILKCDNFSNSSSRNYLSVDVVIRTIVKKKLSKTDLLCPQL